MYRSLLTASAIALTFATPALAAEGWYGGPFAMVGFADNDSYDRSPTTAFPVTGQTDTGGVNGGAGGWFGYDFGPVSIELEGTYRARHDMNFTFTDITTSNPFGAKSNVQTADAMVSALYDLPLGWTLKPYIGGGVGVVYVNSDSELDTGGGMTDAGSSNQTNFAWQLQTGATYPIGDSTDFRFDVRYVDLGNVETPALPTGTADRLSADMTSVDLRLGVNFAF